MIGSKLKINVNIADTQFDNVHGYHVKDQIILHETVSPNYPGIHDVVQVSEYLDNKNYGIHGVTDNDGNIAWALGLGKAIFYHTASQGVTNGYANTRGIGIEQVSRVMLDYKGHDAQRLAWLRMDKELDATARLIACIWRAHPYIAHKTSNGMEPGVTTHWLVTMAYKVPGGHVDAWPVNNGGYYPLSTVIGMAKRHYALGLHF